MPRKIGVIAFHTNGEFIQEFSSTAEASAELGIPQGPISKVINGKLSAIRDITFVRRIPGKKMQILTLSGLIHDYFQARDNSFSSYIEKKLNV